MATGRSAKKKRGLQGKKKREELRGQGDRSGKAEERQRRRRHIRGNNDRTN